MGYMSKEPLDASAPPPHPKKKPRRLTHPDASPWHRQYGTGIETWPYLRSRVHPHDLEVIERVWRALGYASRGALHRDILALWVRGYEHTEREQSGGTEE